MNLSYFQFLSTVVIMSYVLIIMKIFGVKSISEFIIEKYAEFNKGANSGNIGSVIVCNTSRLESAYHDYRGKEQ